MVRKTETQKIPLGDGQIIELYWARNEQAIHETDYKYGRLLYRIAYNYLQDRSDCEECQNDTYLGVWNAIPPHRPRELSPFILKIMKNIAITKYREKKRKNRVPSEITVSLEDLNGILHREDSPEEAYSAAELGRLINEYLGNLTAYQRAVFIGRYYMGDTLEVIAESLDISVSTVHREIEKLKQGLKIHLERNGVYV